MKSAERPIKAPPTTVAAIRFQARHQWVGFVAAALVGTADYYTGPDLSFGVFYLIPIALMAWWHGLRPVSIMALYCAVIWLFVDLTNTRPYAQPMAPYWNAFTRLLIFWMMGFALHRVRHLQLRQIDLLNYIVHDLRNPLMAITANLETITVDLNEEVSPDAKAGVERCRIGAKRMKTLINSILDLARIEDGKMPLDIRASAVGDLVDQAILKTSVYAESKGVRVQSEVASAAGDVLADPEITHRVFVNLLTNAINVSPKESRIRVSADKATSNEVVFAFTDQGPGVPENYITRVFDKFVQVQLRHAGKSTGSGLGLAFCKLAVRAQSGRIWIENGPDRGASVLVALPAVERTPKVAF